MDAPEIRDSGHALVPLITVHSRNAIGRPSPNRENQALAAQGLALATDHSPLLLERSRC
jgi:hypothetical protein